MSNVINNIIYNTYLKRINSERQSAQSAQSAQDAKPYINGKRKFPDDVATSSNPKKSRTVSLAPEVSQTSKDIETAIQNLITKTHLVHKESNINRIFNTFYTRIKKYAPLESIYIEKLTPVLNNIIVNINNKNLSANQCVTIINVLSYLKIFYSSYDNYNYIKTNSILLHKILQLAITSSEDKNHNIIKILYCLKHVLHQNRLLFASQSMIDLLQNTLKEISISSLDCKQCINFLSVLSSFIKFDILTITSTNAKNIISDILEQLKLYSKNITPYDLNNLKNVLSHLDKIQELKSIISNYYDITRK